MVTRLNVLIIDDDPEDLEIVEELLQSSTLTDYNVWAVRTYEEGLRLLDQGPDVFLVDYRMGARSGLDFLREASERASLVPGILLTGAGGQDVDQQALNAGAVDYLPKGDLTPDRTERAIRYAVERARRLQAEARFRALIETGHDLVSIIEPDGTLQYVSPSLRRLLGFDPTEKVGEDAMGETHPNDRDRVERAFREVVSGPPGQHVRLEPYRVRNANGDWCVFDTIAANHTTTPGIGGVVVHSRDITDQVEAQRRTELQASLLAAVGQAVIATDLEGTVFYWNPAAERIYGWTSEEATGRNIMELTTPETSREQATAIMDALNAGRTWSGEFEVHRKNGSTFPAYVTDSPILDDAGQLTGIIGVSSDITDIKAIEAALRERVKELRTLHRVGGILNDSDHSIEARLQAFVDAIPSGWLHPEITEARLRLPDGEFATNRFRETEWMITAPVVSDAEPLGRLDVILREAPSEGDTEPFLQEERELLDNLARLAGDVLGRLRAEAELRESEERFRQIAESINDVFWISSPDKEQVYYVSPAFEQIWGFPPEELIRDPLRWSESILPSDRRRVIRGFAAQTRGDYAVEYRIVREDGEIRWIYDRAFPVLEDGEVVRLIGVAEDVTDRRLAEERYAILSQEIGDGISVVRADGTIAVATPNTRTLLGYTVSDIEGKEFFRFIHPADRKRTRQVFREAIHEPGAVTRIEYRGLTPGGEVRYLESIARNRIDHPAIGGLVVTTRDVTARRELEEQLRQAQKMEAVGRLAGGIAHDFNNLLTVIQSETDLVAMELEDGTVSDDALSKALDSIAATAERAAELTRQLLAFSREQILQPRTTDLATVVSEATRLLERVIGDDISLTVTTEPGLPAVRIDPGQLGHALVNLAINARDAMPAGGTLRISVYSEADGGADGTDQRTVRLDVADDGVGMDEETRSHIFEPFFTTKDHGKGSGLGLAMVYGFVSQSGGTIDVRSSPGEGSTFTLAFPAVAGEVTSPAPTPPPLPTSVSAEGLHILAVEDDSAVRRVVIHALERAGAEVTAVGTAEEAVQAIATDGPFDLILTDLVLPGMSGLRLIDRLQEKIPDMPVILMSGYSDDSPGPDGGIPEHLTFLEKPFTPNQLLAQVKRVVMRQDPD